MEYKNVFPPEKEGLLDFEFEIEEHFPEIQDGPNFFSDNPQQFKEYLTMIITNLKLASNKEQALDCLKNFPKHNTHFYAHHDIIKMMTGHFQTFEILCDIINVTSHHCIESEFIDHTADDEQSTTEVDNYPFDPSIVIDELDNELAENAFACILSMTHVSDEATQYLTKVNSLINIFFENQKYYSELSFALGLRIISNLFVDMDTFMTAEEICHSQFGNILTLFQQADTDERMKNPEVRAAFYKLIFYFSLKFPSKAAIERYQEQYRHVEMEIQENEEQNEQLTMILEEMKKNYSEFSQSSAELKDLLNHHFQILEELNSQQLTFEKVDGEFEGEEETEFEKETIEEKNERIRQEIIEHQQKLAEIELAINEIQQTLNNQEQALSANQKRKFELEHEKSKLSKIIDLINHIASETIQMTYNLLLSNGGAKGIKYLYFAINTICDKFENDAKDMFTSTSLHALKVALESEKDKSVEIVIDIYRILYQYIKTDVLSEFNWAAILPRISQSPPWMQSFVKFISEASDCFESFNFFCQENVYIALLNDFPSLPFRIEVEITKIFINLVNVLPPETCISFLFQNGVLPIFLEMMYSNESFGLSQNILHSLIDINKKAFHIGQLPDIIAIYNKLDMFDALIDQEISFPDEIKEIRDAICQQ